MRNPQFYVSGNKKTKTCRPLVEVFLIRSGLVGSSVPVSCTSHRDVGDGAYPCLHCNRTSSGGSGTNGQTAIDIHNNTIRKPCPGPSLNIKTVFPMGIPTLMRRRSRDRLMISMGIPILIRHLYVETASNFNNNFIIDISNVLFTR